VYKNHIVVAFDGQSVLMGGARVGDRELLSCPQLSPGGMWGSLFIFIHHNGRQARKQEKEITKQKKFITCLYIDHNQVLMLLGRPLRCQCYLCDTTQVNVAYVIVNTRSLFLLFISVK